MIQVPIRAISNCMWLAELKSAPWSTLWELGAVRKKKPLVALKLELLLTVLPLQEWQVHSNWVLSYLSFYHRLLLPSSSNFYHRASLSSFFLVSPSGLLDLVRPFLDLVRPHAVSVFFIFAFVEDPMSETTDIGFDLRLSPLPSNSSSPSLSIPPELFQFWPSMPQYYVKCAANLRTWLLQTTIGLFSIWIFVLLLYEKCSLWSMLHSGP